nr:hypothetical protein Itr_chr14CG33050 [Ipomoea trifida]GMD29127.1 hypothetical protein Iba_scaffold43298CG1130 [Ipomoea batatas]
MRATAQMESPWVEVERRRGWIRIGSSEEELKLATAACRRYESSSLFLSFPRCLPPAKVYLPPQATAASKLRVCHSTTTATIAWQQRPICFLPNEVDEPLDENLADLEVLESTCESTSALSTGSISTTRYAKDK